MANIQITEFSGYAPLNNPGGFPKISQGQSQVPLAGALATQNISIGMSATLSSAFNAQTTLISVLARGICSIAVGNANVAATTSDMILLSGERVWLGVGPGQYLSVIANT